MKKITLTLLALLSLVSTVVFADAEADAKAKAVAGSFSGASIDARNQGTSIGSDLSKSVGFAQAPALTTTLTETCMGSTSVGGGFSGGSFSFGTTWRDSACVRRLDAREIRTYGDVQAAKEIMCDSDQVRAAFLRVGRPCAADGGVYTVAAPVAPVAEAVQAPVATDANTGDESDAIAKQTERMLKNADEAAASLKAKGL
jgi:hypothetical protein